MRTLCARLNCRQITLTSSRYCRLHDIRWRKQRAEQLRTNTGRPATPAELVKLFRGEAKRVWTRAPWWPAMTIWFVPALEVRFIEDCRRAGLSPSTTAPFVLNTLRWAWRRSRLNYDDVLSWERALAAARKRQAKIGPPPDYYCYEPASDTPPDDVRIKQVHRRLNAAELAKTRPPVDRTSKSRARKAHGRRFQAPASFDAAAFLTEHWSSTFGPLFEAHHLDPGEVDGELGRRMAVLWHAVLVDQARLGAGICGVAYERWMRLLRQIRQDQDQGTGHYLRRP
jgi:hypothetical protein